MHRPDSDPASTSSPSQATAGREATAVDPRIRSAWKTWLSALSSDAQAAMAAAFAYESLPDDGRDAWLDALEADAPLLEVSTVALYAPLLAVERDPGRRERIEAEIEQGDPGSLRDTVSLRGVTEAGEHVCVIATSAYLEFVQVLVCHYTPTQGFTSVHHDPLCHVDDAPRAGASMSGAVLEPFPVRVVVEELAHAVLAHRRAGKRAPEALVGFAHLFGPVLEHDVGLDLGMG